MSVSKSVTARAHNDAHTSALSLTHTHTHTHTLTQTHTHSVSTHRAEFWPELVLWH